MPDLNRIRTRIANFYADYHMLQGSDNLLATTVQTSSASNAKKCKCAFCGAELEVGAGYAYNDWRGQRYLCLDDLMELVDRTKARVMADEEYRRSLVAL